MSVVCTCCNTNSRFLHTSVQIRVTGQELEIDGRHRDVDRLFSGPLQHHLRLLDHASEECIRLLRPLLEILLFAREFLRITKAFHMDETRSFFPNMSCREIVDRSCCFSESRFCSHLSSECEYLLLQLCHNLPHRHRHRSYTRFPDIRQVTQLQWIPRENCSSFHRTQVPTNTATSLDQAQSSREHNTKAEHCGPASTTKGQQGTSDANHNSLA